MKEKILIVEDDPAMRLGMNHFLGSCGYYIKSCDDGLKAMSILDSEFLILPLLI